ncbi:MAG: hypothetical protein RBS38_06395 [Bacteroidales bacterium]|jgi:hypothetical protein|nr:hypothetical protein [Bacteroidales bacterium]
MKIFTATLIITGLLYLPGQKCRQEKTSVSSSEGLEIRGIYGSPNAFWNKGISLSQLNVNSVFVNWKAINEKMMERAGEEGLKVFAEFPVLNGKGYVETHPEAWAINRFGNKVEPASWFMGVCPTEPGFREYRMNELKGLLGKFDLGGIWMDYVHWHAQFEEPEPILPETCFCDNCIRSFETATGIDVPDLAAKEKADWILDEHDSLWRDWRCSVIAGWVSETRKIIKEDNPDALLGIYHCPWDDTEYDGARRRILGLDYDMLKSLTDVFSPMVYHGRMGRDAEWVRENIEWFCTRLEVKPGEFPKVWPIVQAYDDPGVISAEEFGRVLRYGAGAGSTGVMMFTTNAVAESPAKSEIMKQIYSEPGSVR